MYEPLKMHPCYKDYLWGGSRLKREFGKVDALEKQQKAGNLRIYRMAYLL